MDLNRLTDRDLIAIEEALGYYLMDVESSKVPPQRDVEMALSKIRRAIGCPVPGGVKGVRRWMEDARAIWRETNP